jgi:hypothetical protein
MAGKLGRSGREQEISALIALQKTPLQLGINPSSEGSSFMLPQGTLLSSPDVIEKYAPYRERGKKHG